MICFGVYYEWSVDNKFFTEIEENLLAKHQETIEKGVCGEFPIRLPLNPLLNVTNVSEWIV